MQIGRSLFKLTRLDSSLLVALAVFIPIFARSKDAMLGLRQATPLLLIGMCTFIANDIDDAEKDQINHPDRPLPSGQIKLPTAAALYFSCLAGALFTTRIYIQFEVGFWYYLLLTLSISYGYVVECFPGFKSAYVACATSIPVLIVAASYPAETGLYLVAGSTFLIVLGRELCMDFVDRVGDAPSFMHRIGEKTLAFAAIVSQAIGLLLLAVQIDKSVDAVVLTVMVLLLIALSRQWMARGKPRNAVVMMKALLFIGLYFLV